MDIVTNMGRVPRKLGRLFILRQAQDDLRQAQDDLRQAQDDLRQAQDDLRQAQDDLRQAQDEWPRSPEVGGWRGERSFGGYGF